MISANAMGIIFPNMHDDTLPELVAHRTMASLPFAGRYRMIDFCLSGMAGAGMQNVGVIARRNYASLMDHLGNGREWDLTRKRGGLVIFPPYAREGSEGFSNRIEMLASVMEYLEGCPEELMVMSDCNVAFNMDYLDLVQKHRASGADVTVVYGQAELAEGMQRDNVVFAFNKDGFVTGIRVNEYKPGRCNLSLNVLVAGRRYMMGVVRECMVRGEVRFVQDFLAKSLKNTRVYGYEFKGYRAHIYSMQSYYKESLRLLEPGNLDKLFPTGRPVFTKVRDEAPVRYAIGATAKRSLVADGCIVEGHVENCILFRGVRVGKGARLKNCVVMQGGEIGPDVLMENVITDKNVTVGEEQRLKGAASFPVFIAKGCKVT